jgi:S-adenosylhomocysteine hydrolase
MLPKKLDEEVATSHLAALDIKLTKLSTAQVGNQLHSKSMDHSITPKIIFLHRNFQ